MSRFSRSDIGPYGIVPLWVARAASPRALALFARLAVFANHEGEAWPSRRTLAEELRCSVDTVDRCVSELVLAGALEVSPRNREGGEQTSNVYRVLFMRPGGLTDAAPRGRMDSAGGSLTDAAPGTRQDLEPDLREPEKNTGAASPRLVIDHRSLFEAFWETYPRKAGKGAAREAFKRAAKKVDPDLIITGAHDFATDPNLNPDKRYIPHPATWLNQERWDDDPLPAPTGRDDEKWARIGRESAP